MLNRDKLEVYNEHEKDVVDRAGAKTMLFAGGHFHRWKVRWDDGACEYGGEGVRHSQSVAPYLKLAKVVGTNARGHPTPDGGQAEGRILQKPGYPYRTDELCLFLG